MTEDETYIEINGKKDPPKLIFMVGMIAIMVTCFLMIHFNMEEMSVPVFTYVGMVVVLIWMRWDLRKQIWFWATIILILLLHVPVVMYVPWPHITLNRITVLPIAFVDYLTILGAVKVVEKLAGKKFREDEEV